MDSPSSTAHFSTMKLRKKKTPRLHQCIQVSLLSGLAFLNSGRGGCSLRELYAFVVENFEGFDIRVEAWKKSIRHSLCTHVDTYVKDAGEGNWKFKDEDLYLTKLQHYIEKNPNYYAYGLKKPDDWDAIRTGSKGLPAVPSREEQKLVSRKRKAEKTHPTPRMKTPLVHRDDVWAHYQPMTMVYNDDVFKPLAGPSYSEALRFHDQHYYNPYYTIQLSENDAYYGYGIPQTDMYQPYEVQSSEANMQFVPSDYQDQYYYYNVNDTAYAAVPVAENEAYYGEQEAAYEMNEPYEAQPEAKLPQLTASFCDDFLESKEAAPSTESCYNEDPYPYQEDVPKYEGYNYPYNAVDIPYYHNMPIDTYTGEF